MIKSFLFFLFVSLPLYIFPDSFIYKNGELKTGEKFSNSRFSNLDSIEKIQLRPVGNDLEELDRINRLNSELQKNENWSMGRVFFYTNVEEYQKTSFLKDLHNTLPKYQLYSCTELYKDCSEKHFSLARNHKANRVLIILKNNNGLLDISIHNINKELEYKFSSSTNGDLLNKLNRVMVIQNIYKEKEEEKKEEKEKKEEERDYYKRIVLDSVEYEGKNYYKISLLKDKNETGQCAYQKEEFTFKKSCQVLVYGATQAVNNESDTKKKFFLKNIDKFLKYNDLTFFPIEPESGKTWKRAIPGFSQYNIQTHKKETGFYYDSINWKWFAGSFLISAAILGYANNNYTYWNNQKSNFSWMWATQNMPSIALYNFPRFSKINQQSYSSANLYNNATYLFLLVYLLNIIFYDGNPHLSFSSNTMSQPINSQVYLYSYNEIDKDSNRISWTIQF